MTTTDRLNRLACCTSTLQRRWLLPLLVTAAMLAQDTNAEQTRRALIIGINDYSSGGNGSGGRDKWTDLDGAINDVEGLKAILVSKYGFLPANIQTLINKEATRKNILDAYHAVLIDPVKKGD
ncbi:MAG: caspase family protein, partial [Kiritimatiellae bacterium]|nr:caspase family protein [Kiritimatiellia bacterium]